MSDGDCTFLTGVSRRQFLAGVAALGTTALRRRGTEAAQSTVQFRRLDVHQHFGSPLWIKRAAEARRPGWQAFQDWTPMRSLEAMDKAGVSAALLSCTLPGVWFGDDFLVERADAIAYARDMNEFGARMVSDYKGRFGLFAVLPLPDIDASLREIAYAFDTLRADGLGLLTSYANHYLGEPMFRPILEELDRRNAIVYSHPTDGPCCHNLAGASPATLEWFTDTARAILSLVQEAPGAGGAPGVSAATRYPNVRYIWSHGGGSLVGVAHRLVGPIGVADLAKPPAPDSRLYHVRRFYYDTAAVPNPVLMPALIRLLGGSSQIVFGSDYPLGNIANIAEGLQTLGFTPDELQGIERDNALRLLPAYKV
jgi:predicted TIM-barrel fold metal-dependent hydrolase